tara:strand:- start:41 stop:274 length:234 start_codon:yes stop_codon:yes gene_type:complete
MKKYNIEVSHRELRLIHGAMYTEKKELLKCIMSVHDAFANDKGEFINDEQVEMVHDYFNVEALSDKLYSVEIDQRDE